MKLLVCKHAPQEGLGCFADLLNAHGIQYDYQELSNNAQPRDLSRYQGLIIMGGPMNVYQEREFPFLKTDLRYIEAALNQGLPVLGFCLGAQLLARVLGSKVVKNTQPELGWYELERTTETGLLQGFPKHFRVFEWHEDTFELPSSATRLAHSAICQNQAFSYGQNLFGLQFHLEVTPAMIQEWLQDEATLTSWGFDASQVITATSKYHPEALRLGKQLFQNFVAVLSQGRDESIVPKMK